MLFLTLSSDQANCSKTGNEYSWAMHNFDLGAHEWVGLSSISMDFERNGRFASSVNLCTNLIDKSIFNESGLIHIIPGKFGYDEKKNRLEFWRLDTRKPRNVTFTFRHANVNKLAKFSVTLAFAKSRDAQQDMVRFFYLAL